MGYICANVSLPIGLSVLDLGPMYATDRRQTDRNQTRRIKHTPGTVRCLHSFWAREQHVARTRTLTVMGKS